VYENKNVAEINGLDMLEGLDMKGVDVRGLMRQPSQVRERQKGIKGGRLELDALKLFLRYMESAENYIAKAETIQGLLWILRDDGLAFEIQSRFGGDTLRTVQEMVSREMSPTGRLGALGKGEATLQMIRSRAVQSFLGLNPYTVLKQPISLFQALSEIEVTAGLGNFTRILAEAVGTKGTVFSIEANEDFQTMIEQSPVMKLRAQHGLIDPEFDNLVKQKYSAIPMSDSKIGRFLQNGMNAIRLFDMITVTSVFTTARESALQQGQSLDDAIQYAEQVVRKTQPPTTVAERSLMQTSNEYVKSTILFTGQLFKNLNMYIYDIVVPVLRAFRTGGARAGMQAIWNSKRAATFAVILPSVMLGMVARRRPQKEPKELFLDLLAYPLSAFPILGASLSRGLRGWEPDAYQAIWSDLVNAANKTIVDHVRGDKSLGDPEDLWDDAKKLERVALTFLGTPQYPFRLMNNFIDEMVANGRAETFPELLTLARAVLDAEPREE